VTTRTAVSAESHAGSGQVVSRAAVSRRGTIQWISGLVTPTHIAQDANNIYWTDPGDDTINAASKSTAQRVVLATSTSGWMAIDDAYVYWIGNGEAGLAALRVPKIGGTVMQIATVAGASEIAVAARPCIGSIAEPSTRYQNRRDAHRLFADAGAQTSQGTDRACISRWVARDGKDHGRLLDGCPAG